MKPLTVITLFFVVALVMAPLFFLQIKPAQADSTIYIQADGTVTGTTNIVRNGSLFRFAGDLPAQLIVQKDNIIIDGAGFAILGDNSRGIVLQGRSNVTVQNAVITSWGGYTIELRSAANCVITNNSIIGKPENAPPLAGGGVNRGPMAVDLLYSQNVIFTNNNVSTFSYGLSLDFTSGHTIVGNSFTNGGVALSIQNGSNCYFRNNTITNCQLGIYVMSYSSYNYQNDLDTSNTIDGKPIIFWSNVNGATVPSNAGYLLLLSCSNILIPNLTSQGINLASCNNCTVTGSTLPLGSSGMHLSSCSGCLIQNCTIIAAQAIYLDSSTGIIVSGCSLISSSYGVYLSGASSNVISDNNFVNDHYAIFPNGDHVGGANTVLNNIFSGSSVAVSMMAGMQIINNTFTNNDLAVLCYSGTSNIITGNTFTNNQQAVLLSSTNNVLQDNHFSNNNDNIPIAGSNFANIVDSSNTIDGKPIYYWNSQHNKTVPSDAGLVILVSCSGITVANLSLTNQAKGILLEYSSQCNITGNTFANDANGIYFWASSNNYFVGNSFTGNNYAVYINGATAFYYTYTDYAASSGNHFYSNVFVNNNRTLYDVAAAYNISNASPSINSWDNGAIGNYWSGYQGVDLNRDGIGDTPYNLSTNNIDNYPLMTTTQPTPTPPPSPTPNPTNATIQAQTGSGSTIDIPINGNITSTQISNVTLATNQSAAQATLSFAVTGQNGDAGFGNLTIPKTAIPTGATPTIYFDGNQTSSQGYTQDANNYYAWFTIHFSTHEISIIFSSPLPTGTPNPAPSTPTTSLATSIPTSQPHSPQFPLNIIYTIIAAVTIVIVSLTILVVYRRKKPAHSIAFI